MNAAAILNVMKLTEGLTIRGVSMLTTTTGTIITTTSVGERYGRV